VFGSEAIQAINAALAAEDDRLTREFRAPRFPVTFLVGLPRAAKTAFHQCVHTALDLGCVSNLLGKFWRAPYLGACLEREALSDASGSCFVSEYGNTSGAHEPSEWGWFWRHWLSLRGDEHYVCREVDYSGLVRKLAAVEAAKNRALFFNSVFAMANLPRLLPHLPGALVVYKHRAPFLVCKSVLNARIRRYGDARHMYGHVPFRKAEMEAIADPVEQVVFQVRSILEELEQLRALLPASAILDVDNSAFCRDPRAAIAEFSRFLGSNGIEPGHPRLEAIPDAGFDVRDDIPLIDPSLTGRLKKAYARHFSQGA
jgi:hypothetical protein